MSTGEKKRSMRRSQLISPFGVGAIVDIGDESFACMDITRWSDHGRVIRLPRLSRRLGRDEFREPPAPGQGHVPLRRFPQWLFCPSCRGMQRWTVTREAEAGGAPPRCSRRRTCGPLVPMRFALACKNGHLDDVPWVKWAHSGRDVAQVGRCENPILEFRTRPGVGSGLASLEIRCTACGSGRPLDDILGKHAMRGIGVRCPDKQPWEFREGECRCTEVPMVLQRGASNVYYPKTVAALDLPAATAGISKAEKEILDDQYFEQALEDYVQHPRTATGDGAPVFITVMARIVAERVGVDATNVMKLLDSEHARRVGDGSTSRSEPEGSSLATLESEEWDILTGQPIDTRHLRTVPTNVSDPDDRNRLPEFFDNDRCRLVKRLREVRALAGFHRVRPGDDERLVPADLGRGAPWLPGVEVFGEGILIVLEETRLIQWEARNSESIEERIAPMLRRREQAGLTFLPEPTARLVLLHTLSHLLLRQIAFECGYTTSSLRERIYASTGEDGTDPMAGILIYTADSDSEGSLGGLVRQGQPDRLAGTIASALEKGNWCSADPICRELQGQGLGGLNRAACHCCALVPETSCTMANSLLDRLLLFGAGTGGEPEGLFNKVTQEGWKN